MVRLSSEIKRRTIQFKFYSKNRFERPQNVNRTSVKKIEVTFRLDKLSAKKRFTSKKISNFFGH